jgi:predicted phosphodiesterase
MSPLILSPVARLLKIPEYQGSIYLPIKCCQRLVAIGDIHGCLQELEELLQLIQPSAKDLIVFLGDLVDRGPDSKGVVDCVRELQLTYPYVFSVLGNHDEKHVRFGYHNELTKHNPGYKNPIRAGSFFEAIHLSLTQDDLIWMAGNPDSIVLSQRIILTHAGLLPYAWRNQPTKGLIRNRYLDSKTLSPVNLVTRDEKPFCQPDNSVLWQKVWFPQTGCVITGHIVVPEVQVLNNCHSIDTGCVFGGKLTAYVEDIATKEIKYLSVKAHQIYFTENNPLSD